LVSNGASLDIRNHNGKTALEIATARKFNEIVKVLSEKVAGGNATIQH